MSPNSILSLLESLFRSVHINSQKEREKDGARPCDVNIQKGRMKSRYVGVSLRPCSSTFCCLCIASLFARDCLVVCGRPALLGTPGAGATAALAILLLLIARCIFAPEMAAAWPAASARKGPMEAFFLMKGEGRLSSSS